MRESGRSEVFACDNESRPECAARRCGPPADAGSLSSRRKGSVNGASDVDRDVLYRERGRMETTTHDEVDVLDIGVSLEL
jgi:hypothetical protein